MANIDGERPYGGREGEKSTTVHRFNVTKETFDYFKKWWHFNKNNNRREKKNGCVDDMRSQERSKRIVSQRWLPSPADGLR